MSLILLGNIVSFIGCSIMVLIGLIRQQKVILRVQCVQFALQATANFMLGAISGSICGIVGIIRNLLITRMKHVAFWKAAFILLQMSLTFLFDGFGLMVWFPILSAAIFTWFIDIKSPVRFKVMIIVAQSLWIVYDLHYQNYSALAFDLFTVLSNVAGIWVLIHARKKD